MSNAPEAWDRDVHPLYEAWKEAERAANGALDDLYWRFAVPLFGGLVEFEYVDWLDTPGDVREEIRRLLVAERNAERAYLEANRLHHEKEWAS